MDKKTICILDTQIYSINGGGQTVVRAIVKSFYKKYNILYIGDSTEFSDYENVTSIKPLRNYFYRLKINKHHIAARAIERTSFILPQLSRLVIKPLKLKADIVISNSTADYLTIKSNKGISYENSIIVKHHPYYEFNEKYPGFIIRNGKFLIFVESRNEKDKLFDKYGKKIRVVYPPVYVNKKIDTKSVHNDIIEKTKNKRVVVSIGRLSENQKRFSLGILSMRDIIKDRNDVIYVIIGSGPDKKKYEKLVNKLNLQDKMFLTGFLNEDEKNSILKKADVLLITSDRETFGLSMAEAFAFSVPVISTKTDGALDFIENGKNGFLVDADERDIAEKVKNILKMDKKKYGKMRKNAFASFYPLNPKVAVKKMETVINELLS